MFLPCFGYIKSTLIDYPGELAGEIFLSGCNFACSYCHNYKLATDANEAMEYDEFMAVLEDIENKHNPITGVVISGGEPTIWPALPDLIAWLKLNTNKKIKLDTNGSNPTMLKMLIDNKLIDCIAMDIKAPFLKYGLFTKVRDITKNVGKSIEIIKTSGLPYYFRCTVGPELSLTDCGELKSLFPDIKFQKCIQRTVAKNAQASCNIN